MRNPAGSSSCVTPAGISNELDVQNKWEENTKHTRRVGFSLFPLLTRWDYEPNEGPQGIVVVVVVVFTLKAVPVSTQYFLTSVLVQLTRTPSVVTG